MIDMRAENDLLVISTIGGTGSTKLKYDGAGQTVEIWQRFVGQPWVKLNLIGLALAQNPALTAEEASEAVRQGEFPTPAMGPGQVLQYGLLLEVVGLDPNAQGFSLGRFQAFVTIVAVLAGDNQTGWITDQNTSVGGTFYLRQVATGALVTTMRMEVGEGAPFSDPATGIWRLPNPEQVLVSPSTTSHLLEALNLLAGHHHFAAILLIDGNGRWSSFREDFTNLRRRVTVNFKHLEIINDDDYNSTGEAQFKFLVRQGKLPNQMAIAREFVFDHGNISDKVNERHITLDPFNFAHVIGPEVVTPDNHDVGVWILGTEFDGDGIFDLFDPDSYAASPMKNFALPTGSGKEQVINAPVIVHATPSSDGSDFEFKVTVMHSIEYMA
jgi:hypothetical protein